MGQPWTRLSESKHPVTHRTHSRHEKHHSPSQARSETTLPPLHNQARNRLSLRDRRRHHPERRSRIPQESDINQRNHRGRRFKQTTSPLPLSETHSSVSRKYTTTAESDSRRPSARTRSKSEKPSKPHRNSKAGKNCDTEARYHDTLPQKSHPTAPSKSQHQAKQNKIKATSHSTNTNTDTNTTKSSSNTPYPSVSINRKQNPSETNKLIDRGAKKDCIVCTENRTLRHFPSRTPTAECKHEISTCKRCLRRWLRTQFDMKVWDQMECPECGAKMGYEDVREFAPDGVFRRYDELSTRAALESIPGFRWCHAKGCKSGQVHDGDLTPRFKCVGCKASYCVVHESVWHKGETCAEYDYRTDGAIKKAEEEASKRLMKQIAKKCPGCKRNIEKRDGCDHMTCSKCRYEFCWICLAPYDPIRNKGLQMHRASCMYHVAIRPAVDM